jgi:HSP20 family protein
MATIEARTKNQEQTVKDNGDKRGLARSESVSQEPQLVFASPFSLMNRLIADLGRLMAEGFGATPGLDPFSVNRRAALWVPAIEAFERDGKLVIRAEVPGMTKDRINIEIDDNVLVLSGERVQERDEKQGNVYRSERGYGGFYRAIVLPEGAEVDQADATFSNGVLEITMPIKARPEAKRLEIKEASGASGATNAEQAKETAQAAQQPAQPEQRANP